MITDIHGSKNRARRILVNDDGGSDLDPLAPQAIINTMADTQVDTHLLCVQYGMNYYFPDGKACECAPASAMPHSSKIEKWYRAFGTGLDPHRAFIRRCRELGKEILISFRMNEGHGLHTVYLGGNLFAGISSFWTKHPEYRIGGDPDRGWQPYFLNYACQEVRDHYLVQLAELMERFEVDGLELDFVRFPVFFPDSLDRNQACDIMTSFVRQVHGMLNNASCQAKRVFAARVPSSLPDCRVVGLDPIRWHQEGLIDFLTVSPQHNVDCDFPIETFKQAMPGLPIYGCIDAMGGTWPRVLTASMIRAAASAIWDRGGNGIYLFNYWLGSACGSQEYKLPLLREIGDPALLKGKSKHYVLNRTDGYCQHLKRFIQLPLLVSFLPGVPCVVTFYLADDPADLAEPALLRIVADQTIRDRHLGIRMNGHDLGYGHDPDSVQTGLFSDVLTDTKQYALSPADPNSSRDYLIPAETLVHGRNRIGFYAATYDQMEVREVQVVSGLAQRC